MIDTDRACFRCCGVRIDGLGLAEATTLLAATRYGEPRSTHLCNAYTLSLALRQPAYRQLLDRADVNFADGRYVALVGEKRGHTALANPIRGPQLMLDTIAAGVPAGLRHYLYGSSPEVIELLATRLRERYPGVELVGVESPPFGALTAAQEAELEERVAAARPDVMWIGLGTPKQDQFVHDFATRLRTTLVPVGAAFDFHAGVKPTAPEWMQRRGLEWAYRLGTEPRRLWKRYLVGNPLFVYGVLTDRRRNRRYP
jgi:N-acetylglucosaminyldiphosphoundecaprenol N-acetyl-beta-D-mannosaminyltransferase